MVWNASTPADNDLMNTVIPKMHEAKEMIRERAVAFNGTINEHNDADSDIFGQHIPSKVSWVKWHTNYAALETFCSPLADFEGTLQFDLATNRLFSVRNGAIFQLSVTDHNNLTVENPASDHNQYIEKEKIDEGTGFPIDYSESGVELNVSSLTVTTDDNLLTNTHATQGFETAHDVVPDISDIVDGTVYVNPRTVSGEAAHNNGSGSGSYYSYFMDYPDISAIGSFFGFGPESTTLAMGYAFTAL